MSVYTVRTVADDRHFIEQDGRVIGSPFPTRRAAQSAADSANHRAELAPEERRSDASTRALLDHVFDEVIPILEADDRARDVDLIALLVVIRHVALATLRAVDAGQ